MSNELKKINKMYKRIKLVCGSEKAEVIMLNIVNKALAEKHIQANEAKEIFNELGIEVEI